MRLCLLLQFAENHQAQIDLHFKSRHSNHVKRAVVRCLYQRARKNDVMSIDTFSCLLKSL